MTDAERQPCRSDAGLVCPDVAGEHRPVPFGARRVAELAADLAGSEASIYLIRGEKVMLDSDLADLYGVRTGRLNEQFNATETGFRRTLPSSLPALNSIL